MNKLIKFKDKIDDIFAALYGSAVNESGEKYSEIYGYAMKCMQTDFYEYLDLTAKLGLKVNIDDLVNHLVWVEYKLIGNIYCFNKVNKGKLEEIILELTEDW